MREQKDRYEIFLKVCETGSFSSITTLWMPEVVHYFKENYPKVKIEILDGNYDEIRDWIIRGQVDCGFLSSIVADDLKFYPLWDDPLCAVFPEGHPLEPACCRTLGLAFSKTASSVVSRTLLEYLRSTRQRKDTPQIK